jgi:hypothetical protein
MGILKFAANAGVLDDTSLRWQPSECRRALMGFTPRHVTSFDLSVAEADLTEGTTKVPVQVVLPAYLQRQMRNVKLHVERSS